MNYQELIDKYKKAVASLSDNNSPLITTFEEAALSCLDYLEDYCNKDAPDEHLIKSLMVANRGMINPLYLPSIVKEWKYSK
jgi:hypothetical protein